MHRHDSSVLMLVNVVRAIIIDNLLLIYFSDGPSSVIKLPRYTGIYMMLLVQYVVHLWQYLFWVNLVSC